MSRKMLINASSPEEIRVAIVQDGILESFEVGASEDRLTKGNIYRGIVVNLRPAMEAAFIDIGLGKDALIRAEDVVPAARHRKLAKDAGRHPRIDALLERAKPILVQVTRDAIGHKGAQVTSNVSLAGRYLVLMPFEEVRGISRRSEDEELRKAAKEKLSNLKLPEGMGLILRTNAFGQPKAALNRDLNALLRLWKKIEKESKSGKGPKFLYSDQDMVVQALRDHLDSSISEISVDNDEVFAKAEGYLRSFMPRAKTKLIRYRDRMPLFSLEKLEEQIDRIYQRSVDLPSGGSIVIDPTEALTAIDVNSGRGTRGANQEENAIRTNLEAAREVARQLRLRDIGGLIVVDFIDMRVRKNNREVEKTLRDAMKIDKARFSVGKISDNGLLEINRQRVKKALQLRSHRPCPTCGGAGTIASPELVGLTLLRRLEARAATGGIRGARIELHPELADAFQNERRQEIAAIEREFDLRIEVIAKAGIHRSEERVEWLPRERKDRAHPESMPSEAAVSAADLAEGIRQPRQGKVEEEIPELPKDKAEQEPGETKSSRKRRRGGRRKKKPEVEGAVESSAEEKAPEVERAVTPKNGGTEGGRRPGEDSTAAGEKSVSKRSRRKRSKKKTQEKDSGIALDIPASPIGSDDDKDRDPFAY